MLALSQADSSAGFCSRRDFSRDRMSTPKIQRMLLAFIVFSSGGIIMCLELCGSRLFAPFLGSSIYIWTSLIAVILATLSLGYYWGGRQADTQLSPGLLPRMLFAAGAGILLLSIFQFPLLASLGQSSLDLRLICLIAATLLFSGPAFFLATVSPIAFRYALTGLGTAATTQGSISALSTLGSIYGTCITGFLLFEWLGTDVILLLLSALCCLLSVVAIYGTRAERSDYSATGLLLANILVLVLLSLLAVFQAEFFSSSGLTFLDGRYQRMLVVDKEEESRVKRMLITDPSGTQSSIWLDSPDVFADSYASAFSALLRQKADLSRVLLLGGGAMSYPKHFVHTLFPDEEQTNAPLLDVVEIDPLMTKVAKEKFFFEPHDRITVFHLDARRFLQQTETQYDVVLLDVFRSSPELPFHLVTTEFFAEVRKALVPGGSLAINIIAALEGDAAVFTRALCATLAESFSELQLIQLDGNRARTEAQNLVLVAGDEPAQLDLPSPLVDTGAGRKCGREGVMLEDNFAPVERLMRSVLRSLKAQRDQNVEKL